VASFSGATVDRAKTIGHFISNGCHSGTEKNINDVILGAAVEQAKNK